MTSTNKLSNKIKAWAQELGFLSVGISKATFLEEEAPKLEQWLKNNFHGQMQYMENHFDKRLDPRKLVDGAKSVISLSYNYYTDQQQASDAPKLSKYAFGEDYHHVVKDKLKILYQKIEEEIGNVHARIFVDSAPVLERAWAKKAGIGWIGKHSLLINKNHGSYFFLAEIIIDVELEYDVPFSSNHCGTCTACIDACPTDAIVENKVVDASKCISYLTIELKDELPIAYQNKMEDWMFGCDICQDVCPWNRFSTINKEPKFQPNNKILSMNRKEWNEITEEVFNEIFKKSAVKRTKYQGLKRNLAFLGK
jgi:epoxyqueuosine reductase